MRIGDFKSRDLKTTSQEQTKNVDGVKKVDFIKTLDSFQEKERNTNLGKLIERIDQTGKALVHSRNLVDLKRYKNAIMDFLEEANRRTYELKEETSWDFMGNRKHHVLIKKIDEKMDELTAKVKNEQEDNLKILELVDEIRGLLVDEYM